jgi:hypothetical protein
MHISADAGNNNPPSTSTRRNSLVVQRVKDMFNSGPFALNTYVHKMGYYLGTLRDLCDAEPMLDSLNASSIKMVVAPNECLLAHELHICFHLL